MRRIAITLIFAGLACPVTALAGTPHAAFTESHEKGVTIYRGQTSKRNYHVMTSLQQGAHLRAEQARLKSRLAIQDRKIAQQQRSIAELKAQQRQLAAQSKPKRRPRYGRSYSGNNPFFGRNGFIGNSNFSGATQVLPRRRRHHHRRKYP